MSMAPKYTMWEAIQSALSVGMKALQEVRALQRLPGRPGRDGVGVENVSIEHDGGRAFKFSWSVNGVAKESSFTVPVPIYRGPHHPGMVCVPGDMVTFEGALWISRSETNERPGGAGWDVAARAGSDGRSFRICGTFAASEKYRALDVVALNGASFVARRDNPGPCPGEGWQLMASQGKSGKPGERGPVGRGDVGPAGPGVVALHVDELGMLTLTNGDGSIVNLDLYPLLSKIAH